MSVCVICANELLMNVYVHMYAECCNVRPGMYLLLIHMTLCFFFKFTYHYQVPACNFLLITSFTSILTIVWNVPFLLSLPGVLVEQIYKNKKITFKVLCDLYDDQVSRCALSEEGVSTKKLGAVNQCTEVFVFHACRGEEVPHFMSGRKAACCFQFQPQQPDPGSKRASKLGGTDLHPGCNVMCKQAHFQANQHSQKLHLFWCASLFPFVRLRFVVIFTFTTPIMHVLCFGSNVLKHLFIYSSVGKTSIELHCFIWRKQWIGRKRKNPQLLLQLGDFTF